ncbi:AAA family ATPase [Kosmotoga pacifica]|uniref:Nucleotide kinase n=1 Tax=Kosmotoga pacifica TaxID=1330330 RepID=A0A0G2ZFS9_9BACT|nr:AAA family ATPase [Kosmotoga pacifica]AKI97648.1 hypothetical protein IX53_07275 [Kosmotoga pacifica]
MKELIIINGPPGIGKSTISSRLLQMLEDSVWLDGDWCWMMNPWVVNEETKEIALKNITFCLNIFLKSKSYKRIIFSWVMHKKEIFDDVLSRLDGIPFKKHMITLMASPEALENRMKAGGRKEEKIKSALKSLPLYHELNTTIIDTSNKSVDETLEILLELIV